MRTFLFALGALVLAAGAAVAGTKATSFVTIDTVARTALGSIADARGSADLLQYIGCHIQGATSYNAVLCVARDAAGVTVSCYTQNDRIVAAAQGMVGDASLQFTWDAAGTCTYLSSSNVSIRAPRQP